MTRTKFMLSIVLATILLATQIIAVGAAPVYQDTTPPITGTVTDIQLDEDTEPATVVVTLDVGTAEPQTLRLSLEDATTLGLIGGDGLPVDPADVDDPLEINPDLVIPDETEEPEEEQHPVGSALADFFSELLGVDYETIMDYHEDGVGFGVIAQALWMTKTLTNADETEMTEEESAALFDAIMDAKQNHAYGDITLPDGSTPENWGQFRKAVRSMMDDPEKVKQNLGVIMSGHADDGLGEEIQEETQVGTQNFSSPSNGVQVQNNNGNGPNKEKKNNGNNDHSNGNNGNRNNQGNGNNR